MGKWTATGRSLRTYPDDTRLRGYRWRTGTRRIESLEGRAPRGDPWGAGRTPEETTRRLREWGEAKDVDRVVSLFADDAVFFMPVTDRVRMRGREEVQYLLGAVFDAADFIRFHTDFGDKDRRFVVYHAIVRGRGYEEGLWLKFNDRCEIAEVVAFVRPVSGMMQLASGVGPRLIRRNGRPKAAVGSAVVLRVLARLWFFVDRILLVSLVTPRRSAVQDRART